MEFPLISFGINIHFLLVKEDFLSAHLMDGYFYFLLFVLEGFFVFGVEYCYFWILFLLLSLSFRTDSSLYHANHKKGKFILGCIKSNLASGECEGILSLCWWDPTWNNLSNSEVTAQEGHGHVGMSPEEGHQDDQMDGVTLLREKAERVWRCSAWRRDGLWEDLIASFSTRGSLQESQRGSFYTDM